MNHYNKTIGQLDALKSTLLTVYADWRVNASKEEKCSYNKTDRILLSFDDFADENTVKVILSILNKENVKAAFFLVGDWANKNPQLINKIEKEGHWVGNHTKTHKNLLKISDAAVREEILGGPSSTLLRPPYGRYDKRIRKIANELGYKICYWDIDTEDWKGTSPEKIRDRILRSLHPGACILMHLNGKHTVKALPSIIKGIREQGYELCYEGKEVAV